MAPFYMSALDSILVPVVTLNVIAMAAIAAIALGTSSKRAADREHRNKAAVADAMATLRGEKTAASDDDAEDGDDGGEDGGAKNLLNADATPFDEFTAPADGFTPEFARFLVTVDQRDHTCVAFGPESADRKRGALTARKAIEAAEEKGDRLRRAALDLAYAAADAVRRNCAGATVPLHPRPGPWLPMADVEVRTLFGVTLHVYLRLVGLSEAVSGASEGPVLAVTVDASAPSCVDPAVVPDREGRDVLTRLAATCAARLLATVAGDEHDGYLPSDGDPSTVIPRRGVSHEALYRFESQHEVRGVAQLVGRPDGGGAEVAIARAAVLAVASLRSLEHLAVIVEDADGEQEGGASPKWEGGAGDHHRCVAFVRIDDSSGKEEADLDAAFKSRVDTVAGQIGDPVINRLLDHDHVADLVVPVNPKNPWKKGPRGGNALAGFDGYMNEWVQFSLMGDELSWGSSHGVENGGDDEGNDGGNEGNKDDDTKIYTHEWWKQYSVVFDTLLGQDNLLCFVEIDDPDQWVRLKTIIEPRYTDDGSHKFLQGEGFKVSCIICDAMKYIDDNFVGKTDQHSTDIMTSMSTCLEMIITTVTTNLSDFIDWISRFLVMLDGIVRKTGIPTVRKVSLVDALVYHESPLVDLMDRDVHDPSNSKIASYCSDANRSVHERLILYIGFLRGVSDVDIGIYMSE